METTTIHPAEAYLRNADNPPYLYVRIGGKRRKLFINRDRNEIGIIAPRKRRQGYYFSSWATIEKIYYPTAEKEEQDINRKLILKYQKLAKLATHSNSWLQKIAAADLTKSPYENRITTGSKYSINSLVYWVTYVHNVVYSFYRKRLLNYILCIRFFIEVHSIVSASRFFHMPTYLRVVIECQSRFFPFFPAFSRNCPDYFLHTSGSSSFRSLSDLGAR